MTDPKSPLWSMVSVPYPSSKSAAAVAVSDAGRAGRHKSYLHYEVVQGVVGH